MFVLCSWTKRRVSLCPRGMLPMKHIMSLNVTRAMRKRKTERRRRGTQEAKRWFQQEISQADFPYVMYPIVKSLTPSKRLPRAIQSILTTWKNRTLLKSASDKRYLLPQGRQVVLLHSVSRVCFSSFWTTKQALPSMVAKGQTLKLLTFSAKEVYKGRTSNFV